MYYEKWGFMLIFWNLAGVPLSYCHCTIYLASHDPETYRWPRWALASLTAAYLFVYWVWDTCNSQKNMFRQEERGTVFERKTFPHFSYGRLKNPKSIPTKTGDSILCDGWCTSLPPILSHIPPQSPKSVNNPLTSFFVQTAVLAKSTTPVTSSSRSPGAWSPASSRRSRGSTRYFSRL